MNRHRALKRTTLTLSLTAATVAVAAVGVGYPAIAAPAQGEIRNSGVPGAIKDSYIVVLKDKAANPAKVKATASSIVSTLGGQLGRTYTHTIKGFSVTTSEAQARKLAARPDVAYVEQNRTVKKSGTQGNPPSWGLDRLDQTALPLDRRYVYPTLARPVRAYVIDTGLSIGHTAFEGRASYGYDFVDDDAVADDCDGHGTHVAGTIGSLNHGVAKGIKLVGVRVLDCEGNGTWANVIAGVDWVTANAVKPAVVNVSLGGERDDAADAAVAASIASGLFYSIAAGNAPGDELGGDACTQSPGRVPAAVTVAATDRTDMRVRFSYVGPCVDMFAPGHGIVSTILGNQFAAYAGTSMAAPHVAGAAALLLANSPLLTPAELRTALVANSVRSRVINAGAGTPNRIVHVGPPPTAPPVSLLSKPHNRYVTTDNGGTTPLIANKVRITANEQFDVVDAGAGLVALRSRINLKYVTAPNGGASPLIANATAIGEPEKFALVTNADTSVSLRANINSKYVSVASRTTPLIASADAIGDPEKFSQTTKPVPVMNLRALSTNLFVTAENAGASPLVANRASVGPWELFDARNMDNGVIAMKAHANSKYVTVTNGGAGPLIANSGSVADAQKFEVIHLGGDFIALRSMINQCYVAADTVTSPLIADQGEIIFVENAFAFSTL